MAPGGPEVDYNHFASVILQIGLLPDRIFQPQFWRLLSLLGRQENSIPGLSRGAWT